MSDTEFEASKAIEGEPLEPPIEIETVENLNTKSHEALETSSEMKNSEDGFLEKEPVEKNETSNVDNDAIKTLLNGVTKLGEQINGLSKLFEAKILHTDHEEKIVDQMHKELQRYKEDMYSQLVRPILLDIIEIRDSILRIALAHQSKPDGEQSIPLKTFEMYASDVQEILEKNSIEIYKSEINTAFVPIRQRVAKKISTSDESLHGKIAESQSDGYSYMEKTIVPEKVAIYFYEPQQIKTESNNTNNKEEAQNG